MKKVFFIISLSSIFLCVHAQSDPYTENFVSIGFEYGTFFESVSDSSNEAKSFMTSPGVNLSVYTFWNGGNFGLFVNDSFLFPSRISSTINGVAVVSDLDVYNYLMQIGLVIGPAYRNHISENAVFRTGVGFSIFELAGRATNVGILAFNMGVGGDVGMKIDLSDSFYIDFGSKIGYDFWNWTMLTTAYGSTSGTASDYSMIRFNPYVSIGFNTINRRSGLGKP